MSETLKISHNSPASSHIRPLLTPDKLKLIGRKFKAAAKKQGWEFDAIAFRGNSGAILSGYLSAITGKPLILVRKESAHSDRKVETQVPLDKPFKYIIADDLIASGDTIKDIFVSVDEMFKGNGTLTGILLYQHFYRTAHEIYTDKYGSKSIPVIHLDEY